MTTVYVSTNSQPLKYAERFESIEDAAMYVLAYDMQGSGINEEIDDDGVLHFVPWQRKMDGRIVRWTVAASLDLQETCDSVLCLADDDTFWIYWSKADYDAACAEIETDADEDE